MSIAECPERLVSLIHNSINIVSVCSQVTPVGQADPGLGFVAQNWLLTGADAVGDAVGMLMFTLNHKIYIFSWMWKTSMVGHLQEMNVNYSLRIL